jgi:hypothetical protein
VQLESKGRCKGEAATVPKPRDVNPTVEISWITVLLERPRVVSQLVKKFPVIH